MILQNYFIFFLENTKCSVVIRRKLCNNMEDDDFLVGGKPLHELRVVDLKKECDKNKLPKNGTKKELIERLKAVCFI